jgi:hypothetical protein
VRLYRGQNPHDYPVGPLWTNSGHIALRFALFDNGKESDECSRTAYLLEGRLDQGVGVSEKP